MAGFRLVKVVSHRRGSSSVVRHVRGGVNLRLRKPRLGGARINTDFKMKRPHTVMKAGDRVTAKAFGNKNRGKYRIDKVYPARPGQASHGGTAVEAYRIHDQTLGGREKAKYRLLHDESVKIVSSRGPQYGDKGPRKSRKRAGSRGTPGTARVKSMPSMSAPTQSRVEPLAARTVSNKQTQTADLKFYKAVYRRQRKEGLSRRQLSDVRSNILRLQRELGIYNPSKNKIKRREQARNTRRAAEPVKSTRTTQRDAQQEARHTPKAPPGFKVGKKFNLVISELEVIASQELAEPLRAIREKKSLTQAQTKKLQDYLREELSFSGMLHSSKHLEAGMPASTAYGIERQARKLAEALGNQVRSAPKAAPRSEAQIRKDYQEGRGNLKEFEKMVYAKRNEKVARERRRSSR